MFSDFGDLDLIDDSDSARDRNERLSRAFEKSKESYAKELVYTEPEWYDPPEIPAPTKLQVRNIDFYLNKLYLSGRYAEALPLALSQLEPEEDNVGKDGRELQLLDTCIHLALKLNETELAGRLSERGMPKILNQPGLASTCAEGFLACCQSRLALRAVLSAISQRGKLPVSVSQLFRALGGLRNDAHCDTKALDTLVDIARTKLLSSNSLLPDDSNEVMKLVEACGISGTDQALLVALLCQTTAGENETTEGKSVKML